MYHLPTRISLSKFVDFQDKIESIHNAVDEGSVKNLQSLLNRKKYALAQEKSTGASILHKAIVHGHTEIVT